MRKHQIAAVTIGLCVGFLAAGVQADLLIEDTFTGYRDNALITDSPAGKAEGLIGDWMTPEANEYFFVNRTQLDFDAGTGKAVYDANADFNKTRQVTRETSADHVLFENGGDVFYASFLIDPARADGQMLFGLELSQSDNGGTADFVFGINNGQYTVGNGAFQAVAGGSVGTGEQLVLVRIEYGDGSNGTTDDEIVTLWVDPDDESSTPVIDGVADDLLNQGGGLINSISMRGAQMNGAPAFFDNLRVGTSFASVVPEPSTLTLLTLGLIALFPMLRRRR